MIGKNKKTLPATVKRPRPNVFVITQTVGSHKNTYHQRDSREYSHKLRALKLAIKVKRWRS